MVSAKIGLSKLFKRMKDEKNFTIMCGSSGVAD